MVDCNDLLGLLGDYLDDAIAAGLRADIERHLTDCLYCKVVVDSTQKTIRIVTESGSFDLPAEVSERIVAGILKRMPGGGGTSSSTP